MILCKRRPQAKDLLFRPYGRFYYIPYYLASSGNKVIMFVISYKNEEEKRINNGNLVVHSISLFPNPISSIFKLYKYSKEFSPDWVFGFSDTYYGIAAYFLSLKFRAKSLIDAYDNYEAYIPWLKPWHYLWRYSIKKCDVVTSAGPSLQNLFAKFRFKSAAEIIPMAADPIGFEPLNKDQCRQKLKLPTDKKIIGYSGSIHRSRDIETLFNAVAKLRKKSKDTILVISGRIEEGIDIPEGVIYVGYIEDEEIPVLINCFDCAVVMNKNSKFGNYSYPIKLYEAMACEIPLVVSKTESTAWIMKEYESVLVEPGDIEELSAAINKSISLGRVQYGPTVSWQDNAKKIEAVLLSKSI